MNDHIDPSFAVQFYQTLIHLLQGGEAIVFCPNGRGATVALVDGVTMISQLNEQGMETGKNPFNLLLQVADQA